MQKKSVVISIVCIAAAFALGYVSRGGVPDSSAPGHAHTAAEEDAGIRFWTCSMHPQIQQPGPGQCPLCGMDLIPVRSEQPGGDTGPRDLVLSPSAAKLAEIRTAPVQRKFVASDIRLDGKVEYDETRLFYITSWVAGRIDRLFVDYTGVRVAKGDHMVSLYSPELLTAQRELILGVKMLKSSSEGVRGAALKNLEASREKLRLWGLTSEQISDTEQSGRVSDHVTIYSPISGIVVKKSGVEGMYVNTGTRIYTVADLSHLWVMLDAYESDLIWLRYGQDVEFTTKAFPGERFTGRISFIDPVLNATTRTVKVRVAVPNPDGRLKPNMFVSARVHPRVAAGGRVMDARLAGKWICPMHPENVREGPGRCDICGMDLVTPESLGYVTAEAGEEAPLIIPASAPLITGKRAVVYVAVPEKQGVFEGREVVLGPRAGDYYLVREGLREGEHVVVNGNFKIDSALQILARPSMMSPEGSAPPPGHDHGAVGRTPVAAKPSEASEALETPEAFKKHIDGLLRAYYEVQQALSRDQLGTAQAGAGAVLQKLGVIDMRLLQGRAHLAWMEDSRGLKKAAGDLAAAAGIEAARKHFEGLSEIMYRVAKKFGTGKSVAVKRFFCPMAFNNRGAHWLQPGDQTENPYFGSAMFRCGSKVETIAEEGAAEHTEGHSHE